MNDSGFRFHSTANTDITFSQTDKLDGPRYADLPCKYKSFFDPPHYNETLPQLKVF